MQRVAMQCGWYCSAMPTMWWATASKLPHSRDVHSEGRWLLPLRQLLAKAKVKLLRLGRQLGAAGICLQICSQRGKQVGQMMLQPTWPAYAPYPATQSRLATLEVWSPSKPPVGQDTALPLAIPAKRRPPLRSCCSVRCTDHTPRLHVTSLPSCSAVQPPCCSCKWHAGRDGSCSGQPASRPSALQAPARLLCGFGQHPANCHSQTGRQQGRGRLQVVTRRHKCSGARLTQ